MKYIPGFSVIDPIFEKLCGVVVEEYYAFFVFFFVYYELFYLSLEVSVLNPEGCHSPMRIAEL